MERRGLIKDIEALRAVAVIYVVVHHAIGNLFVWQDGWKKLTEHYFAGWVGVDLFFVISGFVIARDLCHRISQVSNVRQALNEIACFWIKRAWRLFPSAWAWLFAAVVLSAAFNHSGVFSTVTANVEMAVASFLSYANLWFAAGFGNFEMGASFVHWSLSLETQFYLILPLVLLTFGARSALVLIPLILWQLFQERSLLAMQLRTDGLLLGVVLAFLSQHPLNKSMEHYLIPSSRIRRLVMVIVLLTGLALAGSPALSLATPLGMAVLISGALVWLASFDKDYVVPNEWLQSVLGWIGTRSYAIYLIHIPAFFITREFWWRLSGGGVETGSLTAEYLGTAGFLIVVLAELNYRFVEMPLRTLGRKQAASYGRRQKRSEVAELQVTSQTSAAQ